jgi:hypothetical protein
MKKSLRRVILFCSAALALNTPLNSQIVSQKAESADYCAGVKFVEKDRLVVIEVESVTPGSGWRGESLINGFTGANYARWDDGNRYNSPGSGLTQYKIKIKNPGIYHFRWHSKIMNGTDPTQSNDSWLRIPDAADFFAKNGSSVKYPNGGKFIQSDVVTNGSSSNGWMKVYSSGTTSWTWSCRTSDHDAHEIYAAFDTAGVYTVQISGRSENHAIDRFVLFVDSAYSIAQATDKSFDETLCADADQTYVLTVNHGRGGGNFAQDTTVNIVANNAPSNMVFEKWTGDTVTIADIDSAATTITIPSSDVNITATYKDVPGTGVFDTNVSKLKIFPNPAKGDFVIDLKTFKNPVIKIYSLTGDVVYQTYTYAGKYYVKDHKLPSGPYLIHVSDQHIKATSLLVIQ